MHCPYIQFFYIVFGAFASEKVLTKGGIKLHEYPVNGKSLTLQQTAKALRGFGTAFVLTTSFMNVSYNFLWNAVIRSKRTYSSFWGSVT